MVTKAKLSAVGQTHDQNSATPVGQYGCFDLARKARPNPVEMM